MDGSRDSALDESDDVIIIYNRVPKTASTSFTNIAYDLCVKNRFHVLHINTTKNNPVMSLQDQVRFVKNVTSWREMKPGFYHGHVAFLDFTKNVGSRWALDQAKYNLVNEYLLVGVTEELEDFIMMLEAALPRFFRGATELYRTGKKSHLRKTTEKKPPTKESITKLQQSDIWKMENEFYEFALEQFQFVRAHAVREKDGELYLLAQNFFYEKIYPKIN
ncbi:HS2ST sulfotransferase, partial [Polypterus senegalus]